MNNPILRSIWFIGVKAAGQASQSSVDRGTRATKRANLSEVASQSGPQRQKVSVLRPETSHLSHFLLWQGVLIPSSSDLSYR
jgi:hypothetical protein